jgi:nucleoside-diphosphate-sugar epimerase
VADRPVVLVTGSSGLIGSAISRRLLERYAVVGFDREGGREPPRGVQHVDVDITDSGSLSRAFDTLRAKHGERLASVIHLAAYYDFSGEKSEKYDEITVQGTEHLMDGLGSFEVEQFAFSSTMLVHAPTEPGRPIDEGSPVSPKWAYPESKVRTEAVIHAKRGDMKIVILRIAGVYDDRCHSVPIAHQIQRIVERRETAKVFPGDVSHGQSFVHLDDTVDAIVRCVDRRASLPRDSIILIGEPETLSYAELQIALGQLIHGEGWETTEIPKPVAKAGAWVQDLAGGGFIKPFMVDLADDHYELDVSRARKALGWSPKHSLRETLPTMVEALKEDPERFYKENKLGDVPASLLERHADHQRQHRGQRDVRAGS